MFISLRIEFSLMASEKLPSPFTLQFGAGMSVNESVNELFLRTSSTPTFPFLNIRLVPDDSKEDSVVEIKANKQVYEFIKNTGQSDDLVFFLDANGSLVQWSPDMIIAMKTLSKMAIFVDFESWINDARKSLNLLATNEKVDAKFNQQNALKNSHELLNAMGILEDVNQNPTIFPSAREVLREKNMDSGTLIYRLAMAIYHSGGGTGKSILALMDDPSSAYLKLATSPMINKWEDEFAEMMDAPLELRIKIMKVLMAFAVSSYVYNKLQGEKSE